MEVEELPSGTRDHRGHFALAHHSLPCEEEEKGRHAPEEEDKEPYRFQASFPGLEDVYANHSATVTSPPGVLLELVLPVVVKLQNSDDATRYLGLSLRLGRGPNNISRTITIRLTDTMDPFFLYELELSEEDYGIFKQKLELVVDFTGFPKFLVEMLQGIEEGVIPLQVTFCASSADACRGTLRVIENTAFRTIEHISLVLIRQGDSGQKKYLAERFQYFEAAFKDCSKTLSSERAQFRSALERLHKEKNEACSKYCALLEEKKVTDSQNEHNHLKRFTEMKDQYEGVLNRQREDHCSIIADLQEKFRLSQQQMLSDLRAKDEALQTAHNKYVELEAAHSQVESDLRLLTTRADVQEKELNALRQMNNELKQMRVEAIETMNQKDLVHATQTERLNATAAALASKIQDYDLLKNRHDEQSSCINILSAQNEESSEKIKDLEKSISKAHYIIKNQLQSITSIKERYKIAAEQVRTQEQLLSERQLSINRLRDEGAIWENKANQTERTSKELKEQLEKTCAANEELVKEVDQLKAALVQTFKEHNHGNQYFGRRILAAPSVRRYETLYGAGGSSRMISPSLRGGTPVTPQSAEEVPSQDIGLERTAPRKVTMAAAHPWDASTLKGKTFLDHQSPSPVEASSSAYFSKT